MAKPSPRGAAPPRLAEALEAVARWREAEERDVARQLDDLDRERARLEALLTEMRRQLRVTGGLREQLLQRARCLEDGESERMARAIHDTLAFDAAMLRGRSDAVMLRQAEERDLLDRHVREDAELQDLLRRFAGVSTERTRSHDLEAHRRAAVEVEYRDLLYQLRPYVEQAEGAFVQLDLPHQAVAVLVSVDQRRGRDIVVVLPSEASVLASWREQEEDVVALFTLRLYAALARVARRWGSLASITWEVFRGVVAFRLTVPPSVLNPRGDVEHAIERVGEDSVELHSANLELSVVRTSWAHMEKAAALAEPRDVLEVLHGEDDDGGVLFGDGAVMLGEEEDAPVAPLRLAQPAWGKGG